MGDNRLLVIGWDSAPHGLVLERLLPRLPNLRRVVESGVSGPLRSSHPPITVPAWACMTTSCNPGRLGFYGFRNRAPGSLGPPWIADSTAVRAPRVWDTLGAARRRVCVITVPQTYPARPLNGAMVAGFPVPESAPLTYPERLQPELDGVAGGRLADSESFRVHDTPVLLDRIYAMSERRFRAARWLLGRERWDFFMLVEMGSDRIQHGFWRFMDPGHPRHIPGSPFAGAIGAYYAYLDARLGELIELFGEGSVMVVSDHGAKPMQGCFAINQWLAQEGYLRLKTPAPAGSLLDPALVDWPNTRAWAWGGYCARVFINLRGREPQGAVEPRQYEALRTELGRRIAAIPDDRGRPMGTVCVRPEEVFSGPHVASAPDLLVYLDDLRWRPIQTLGHPSLYRPENDTGPDDAMHDHWGMVAVRPRGGVRPGRLEGASILDIAPTMLRLMGIEAPGHYEGRALV